MSIGSGSAAKMRYAVNKKMPVAIFEMGGGQVQTHECTNAFTIETHSHSKIFTFVIVHPSSTEKNINYKVM